MPARKKPINTPQPIEAQFQRAVIEMANVLGWRHHHEANSFGTKPGWPDLALFHPSHGALYLELKTRRGKVTDAQADWISWLQRCGQRASIVYPDQMDAIEALLHGENVAIEDPQLPLWEAAS